MTDHLANFLTAQQAFGERVHAITDEQWQLPTPDTEWSVADLVAHLVEEHRFAAALVHGMDVDAAQKIVDGARVLPVDGGTGGNFAEAWDEASAASATPSAVTVPWTVRCRCHAGPRRPATTSAR